MKAAVRVCAPSPWASLPLALSQASVRRPSGSRGATRSPSPRPQAAIRERVPQQHSFWRWLFKEMDYETEGSSSTPDNLTPSPNLPSFVLISFLVEQLCFFGVWFCFDSLLHACIVLPCQLARRIFSGHFARRDIFPLVQFLLLITGCWLLTKADLSYIYHNIKTQSTVKLYVIVNMFEVLDRLATAMGMDIMLSLSGALESTFSASNVRNILLLAAGVFIYLFVHIFVILYQVIALSVAINAHDASLLAILLSNQFIEIKGAVFKRVDATGHFQFICYDLRERFLLIMILVMIATRNLAEVNWNVHHLTDWLIYKIVFVMSSEMVVDTIKHTFLMRFNDMPTSVFHDFEAQLCRDLVEGQELSAPLRSRKLEYRLGFTPLPIACLLWKYLSVVLPDLPWHYWLIILPPVLGIALVIKVINRSLLHRYAAWRLESLQEKQMDAQPPQNRRHHLEGNVYGPYDRYRHT
ncbi:uncharacterized protein MONBRDRAFT_32336 [Monosiga brevicollis MX1]|uniref:Uncharacterized protein n=1 Tax=Monosiga brevicollis TaxID=81824 RepID=A9UYW0_MONBE|nr:uncharacterized protein MONBRDRAFT_32336 [Monosiga brevicollis MX1]EDQ89675.1 predicted protein [Monosiga brevicollis MX1]|eukprot:XP_001745704.1 hypothetical protein [Monosiga brevicollis MX1]